MGHIGWWEKACVVLMLCGAGRIGAGAQTLTTLVTFDGSNGEAYPTMSLAQGVDGTFYGTTAGGDFDNGAVFKLTPSGTLTILYSFCAQPCPNGENPYGGLVLATDGDFYGTTYTGGSNTYYGTVFKVTPEGTLTTLHSFAGSEGSNPITPLIQATDGNLYGTTGSGGGGCSPPGCGTVFKMTLAGELTTLHSFDYVDGQNPVGGLVEATDGSFYGTTYSGGAGEPLGTGTVFQITRAGRLTTLYSFCAQIKCADGANPGGGLVQASNGYFYGTTSGGGVGCGDSGCGTVFRIDREGRLTTMHRFEGPDGESPRGSLIQATDGNLYGTTLYGGVNGDGTIFRITAREAFATLYSFCALPQCSDGNAPLAGLFQATTGNLYGTTAVGGGPQCLGEGCGTIYSLSLGLGPFVTFVRAAGKVGQIGGILGQGFTGTTSVSLNGTPADFTVVSDTFIKATVPAGATTGYVTVTTPTGTLTSNLPFHVIR
jgi:uncharacterized repeat protein (TIGR03803 family)